MNKYILFIAMFFVASMYAYSQGEMDAFKLSRNDQIGTARSMAMGGAFGALGADITGIAQNPGGIGVYRSSEIVATLGFTSNSTSSNTAGVKLNNNKFSFVFDNIACVGYVPLSGDIFKSFNFGFSYNRLKNFDRVYSMEGSGIPFSLSDYIAGISNGYSYRELEFGSAYDPYRNDALPWLGILGYNAEIINNIPGSSTEYESAWDLGVFNDGVDNRLKVSERGHIESYDFTMGTNILDMLYLGLTVSITDINYSLDTYYVEDFFPSLSDRSISGFDLENYTGITGSGHQISLGGIYRPIDELRIGIAYHSPTWYNLEDIRSGYLGVVLPDGSNSSGYAPDAEDFASIRYNLQTPDRLVASIAGVLGTNAIVSVDYEYSNYGNMKLRDDDNFEYEEDNMFIREDFKGASTLKAGIEYRVTPQFSIRGGYCWEQSPLEAEIKNGNREVMFAFKSTMPHFTLEGNANTFSFGVGYKFTPQFYIDLGYSFKSRTDDLYAFSNIFSEEGIAIEVIPSKLNNYINKGIVTLGCKF